MTCIHFAKTKHNTEAFDKRSSPWADDNRPSFLTPEAGATPAHRSIPAPSLLPLIGQTPLLRLTRIADGLPETVALYVKLEGMNPGGSVKDRAASFIVQDALCSGALAPGKTLIDATSGNTGIAYAMLGAALGFSVKLALAANASPERLQILYAYGAELILSDPAGGTEGARQLVQEMVAATPECYFYADQYNNPANPQSHFSTTGPEIWQQTKGQITHFVAGIGTGGTLVGIGRYLRKVNPAVRLVGVQPEGPQHGIAGLKHLATSEMPRVFTPELVDTTLVVQTHEAETMARRLARSEGVFVGISSGAAVVAAIRVARELRAGTVVALLPDGGYKYTSAAFWQESP
ncbi:MAG: PLP-dependent cysteine synthase family protein [Anaerolineae bacterium]|nr:PLP-dependent cysteine synthase family protein [Anaerolineae bacterium]